MLKYCVVLFIAVAAQLQLGAQVDSIAADPKDIDSPRAIVGALYDVVSGPAGQKRNWPRMRTLFSQEAKLIPVGMRAGGISVKRALSIEEYIGGNGPYLEKEGFFEKEINFRMDQFGQIAQVFSTYESRHRADDKLPFMRGINSIQLWNDGKRWWIINILWQNESPTLPIPSEYAGG